MKEARLLQKYSPEEALALIIDTNLTKNIILIFRELPHIYPIYPKKLTISESEVAIRLQDLLDLAIRRLFQVQAEIF